MLQLINLASGETVVQLYQKGMSKESWPALQLSSDEMLLAHMVNNTVNLYQTEAFAKGICCTQALQATLCCIAFSVLKKRNLQMNTIPYLHAYTIGILIAARATHCLKDFVSLGASKLGAICSTMARSSC